MSVPELLTEIAHCPDIVALAAALLRVCDEHLEALIAADSDETNWRAREAVRERAQTLFEDIDDEELDDDDCDAIVTLAREACDELPAVVVARAIAEGLDFALGDRFLPMYLNRRVELRQGDPVPTPRPDWRRLTLAPNSDPWKLDGRLDALPHVRLAGDWTRHVTVELNGDWRTWHSIPQITPDDTLACAAPNDTFAEFTWDRRTIEGRPVFFDVRPVDGDAAQTARCLNLLELARARGTRIVVFPELSAPAAVVDAIAAWLDGQDVVQVVVAGSRHVANGGGGRHNESTTLFRGARWRLTHRKFRPYSFVDAPDDSNDSGAAEPVRRYEHLTVDRPVLRAYLSPAWTMVVLICKDLILEPIPRALRTLRANLVLVPALSFKMDAFRTAAADVATWSQGIAVVANAGLTDQNPITDRVACVFGLPAQEQSTYSRIPAPRSLVLLTLRNKRKRPLVEVVVDESAAP